MAESCHRCGGTGYFQCYSHIHGGKCFRCEGSGKDPGTSAARREPREEPIEALSGGTPRPEGVGHVLRNEHGNRIEFVRSGARVFLGFGELPDHWEARPLRIARAQWLLFQSSDGFVPVAG